MSRRKDISGQRFSRLVVLGECGRKNRQIVWNCRCDCGNFIKTLGHSLRAGVTKSCGCLRIDMVRKIDNTLHGYHQTPTYHSWEKMKSRCSNPNNPSYSRYGGLGISYDPSWENFETFLRDMGERPEGKTLDRIDPFGDYGPQNCRWATPKEQANNQRRHRVSRGGQDYAGWC